MAAETAPRAYRGVKLDVARLEYECARRGLTFRRLSEISGVSETIISFARSGRSVSMKTFAKLSAAIAQTPLTLGADALLLVRPEAVAEAVR